MGRTHCHVTQLKGTFLNEDLTFHKYQHEEFEASSSSVPRASSGFASPAWVSVLNLENAETAPQSVNPTDGN